MTREKAKEICEIIETHGIEVIKAYGEGKTIQHLNLDGEWVDCDMPISFENNHSFRVKPEETDHSCNCKGCKYISLESVDEPCCNCCIDSDKYEKKEQTRPFKNCDELVECWERKMYIPAVLFTKDTRNRLYRPCIWVKNKNDYTERLIVTFGENFVKVGSKSKPISLYVLFSDYEFLDGSPCGITE